MMSAEDIANFHSEIIDLQSFEEVSTMSAEDTSNLHAEVTDLQSNEEASPMSEGNSILHAKMADLQSNEEASSMSTEGNSILHTEVMDLQSNEEVSTSNASTVVDECTPTPSATNINIAASSEFSQVVPPSPLLINAEASSSAINNGSSKPCHSPSHSSPRINEGASSSAINDGSSKSCHSPSHSCPIINEGASSSAMNNKSSKLCQCPDHAVHKISDNALHAIVKSGNKKKASSSGIKKKSSKIFKRSKYNPYAPLLPEHIKGLTPSKIKRKTTVPSDIHGKSSTSSTSVPAKTFRINEGASTSKADDDEDDDDDDDDSIFVVPAPPPPRQPTPLKRILTIPLHPKFRIGDKVLIKIQCKEVCAEIIKPPYDVLQKMLPGSHYVRCLADETRYLVDVENMECYNPSSSSENSNESKKVNPPERSAEVSKVISPEGSADVSEVNPPERSAEVPKVNPPKRSAEASKVIPPEGSAEASKVYPPEECAEVSKVNPPEKSAEVSKVIPPKKSAKVSKVIPAKRSAKVSKVIPSKRSAKVSKVIARKRSAAVSKANPPESSAAVSKANPPEGSSEVAMANPPEESPEGAMANPLEGAEKVSSDSEPEVLIEFERRVTKGKKVKKTRKDVYEFNESGTDSDEDINSGNKDLSSRRPLFRERQKIFVPPKMKVKKEPGLKVGFLGLGRMGTRFVQELQVAGFNLTIWNRTHSKCDQFLRFGVQKAKTPREVVKKCHITFCCVTNSEAFWKIFSMDHGIRCGVGEGKQIVNLTTLYTEVSKDVEKTINERGGKYLEVCLLPADETGVTLQDEFILLASGNRDSFQAALEPFKAMSSTIYYLGDEAQLATKASFIWSSMAGVILKAFSDSSKLLEKLSLNPYDFLQLLSVSPLGSSFLIEKGHNMIFPNEEHTILPLEHLKNNLTMLSTSIPDASLPVTASAREDLVEASRNGHDKKDVSAISLISW